MIVTMADTDVITSILFDGPKSHFLKRIQTLTWEAQLVFLYI